MLDARERARARRLQNSVDRKRYVQGRGALRRILSRYRGEAAPTVALFEASAGKPMAEGVEFSASHAQDDFVCAVTHATPLGIDIEHHVQIPDLDDLLFVCSSCESALIRTLSEPERSAMFLRLWTRKEAALKAAGCGLGRIPADEVDVLGGLVRIGAEQWRLTDIPLAGLICALATRGTLGPAVDVVDRRRSPVPTESLYLGAADCSA